MYCFRSTAACTEFAATVDNVTVLCSQVAHVFARGNPDSENKVCAGHMIEDELFRDSAKRSITTQPHNVPQGEPREGS